MKIFLVALLGLFLAACTAATDRLDTSTGTSLEQRCIDYQVSRSVLNARGTPTPTLDAFIATYCTPPPPNEVND